MRRLLVLVLMLTGCGTTSARLAAPTPAASDGPLYGGSGRVVSVPGKPVRFCAPVATRGVLISPRPAPAYCDLGIDVEGVDLNRLEQRREQAGAVEGQASLTGTFDGTVLHVRTQSAPSKDAGLLDTFDDPPCTPPPGGWPTGPENENLNTDVLQGYQAAHDDEVPMVALARPSERQVLAYLLTAGDVTAAEAALRPTYGARLCVAKSNVTVAQVHAAQTDPGLQGGPGTQIYAFAGTGLRRDGQVTADVSATYETPAIAAAVARHPKGLVRLDLFLKPVP